MKALCTATALLFVGCVTAGPGSYGTAEYPLEIYTIDTTMSPEETNRIYDGLKARLKQEGLWSDVDDMIVDKYMIRLWAAVNVHIRFPDLLKEITQRRQ